VLTPDLKVIFANHSFYETFQVAPEETEGRFIFDAGNHQWDIPSFFLHFFYCEVMDFLIY